MPHCRAAKPQRKRNAEESRLPDAGAQETLGEGALIERPRSSRQESEGAAITASAVDTNPK
jgi:hypothetical protein